MSCPELGDARAVLFGCYGTLIDVAVDEESRKAYEVLSTWLGYEGVDIDPVALRREYRERVRSEGGGRSGERFPALDLVAVWRSICMRHRRTPQVAPHLPHRCVLMFRAITVREKAVLPGILPLLDSLRGIPLGVVSDAQCIVGVTELRQLGLFEAFNACVWASDYGYGKPDERLFRNAAKKLSVPARHTLFIGGDPWRDLAGALDAGMMACHIDGVRTVHGDKVIPAP
ncbi:MAG: HAD family hydrolase [Methanomicrobiaceae archaeon]|nr:HAD family hydrolase [Methanomicrobiaceae archaeon]